VPGIIPNSLEGVNNRPDTHEKGPTTPADTRLPFCVPYFLLVPLEYPTTRLRQKLFRFLSPFLISWRNSDPIHEIRK
jgi:hypothetical protein